MYTVCSSRLLHFESEWRAWRRPECERAHCTIALWLSLKNSIQKLCSSPLSRSDPQRINGKNWTDFIIVKFQNFDFLKVPYFCRINSGLIFYTSKSFFEWKCKGNNKKYLFLIVELIFISSCTKIKKVSLLNT